MLSGVYSIYRKGKEPIHIRNLITNQGFQNTVNDNITELVKTLQLSREQSEASKNVATVTGVYKEVEYSEANQEASNWGVFFYRKQFVFLVENCPGGDLSKLSILSSDGSLFSVSRVKDSKGNPLDLYIEPNENIVIIYELRWIPTLSEYVTYTNKDGSVYSTYEIRVKLLDKSDSSILDNLDKPLSYARYVILNGVSVESTVSMNVDTNKLVFTANIARGSLNSVSEVSTIDISTNRGVYRAEFVPPLPVEDLDDTAEYSLTLLQGY